MNRRELLASSSAGAAIVLLGGAVAASPEAPIRTMTDLEHRLVREGMCPKAPMIFAVQTCRTAFVEGNAVAHRVHVLVHLDDGTKHEVRDCEAMRLAWSQVMARQPGVSRTVAYDHNWIQQIARLV